MNLRFVPSMVICIAAAFGCAGEDESQIEETVKAVSQAVHAKNPSALYPHLSQRSLKLLSEVHTGLKQLKALAAELPESTRKPLIDRLPTVAKTNELNHFLAQLIQEQLNDLQTGPETTFGLRVAEIRQQSKDEALVTTKSKTVYSVSREANVWKIHLFEAPLSKILEASRKQNLAIKLTLDRLERRRQIESVLNEGLRKKTK